MLLKCSKCNIFKEHIEYYNNHAQCKECHKKSRLCEHEKIKSRCKDCDGNSLCKEHGKRKDTCNICNVCKHGKDKRYCKECDGSSICKHNICISNCKICGGFAYCHHDRMKATCKICKPNSNKFCKQCRLFIVNKVTNFLCSYCNKSKYQKKKEIQLKTFLENYEYKFQYNQYINYLGKKYYTDFIIKCNNFLLIIECDEYAHKSYDKNNEKTRENNIKIALNEKCVFLRFNPDKKKIKIETKQKVLKSYIDYYINKNKSYNDVVYLFY